MLQTVRKISRYERDRVGSAKERFGTPFIAVHMSPIIVKVLSMHEATKNGTDSSHQP
jgi:hypothetical protein